MAVKEAICLVQLIHPGGEPSARNGSEWNKGKHTRKYLRVGGHYLDGAGKAASGQIEFWGEWEAESDLIEEFGHQLPGKPQRVWRPYYEQKADYTGLQNTDPFVFGGFYYTGCLQNDKRGATQLRHLQPGSVILFGSQIHGQFVLDTVFVVADYIDHDAATYRENLAGIIPGAYWDVVLYPRYRSVGDAGFSCAVRDSCDIDGASWRLYIGATYANPIEGMFSFFPCQPAGQTPGGFARPSIAMDGISPRLGRGYKIPVRVNYGTLAQIPDCWQRVVEQVRAQGLDLGIAAEVPPSGRP